MIDLEIVTLENGIDYAIAKEKNDYLYLINVNDQNDFCIRKSVLKDSQEYIDTLGSDEEFDYALALIQASN